jgi:hypothetical protein
MWDSLTPDSLNAQSQGNNRQCTRGPGHPGRPHVLCCGSWQLGLHMAAGHQAMQLTGADLSYMAYPTYILHGP